MVKRNRVAVKEQGTLLPQFDKADEVARLVKEQLSQYFKDIGKKGGEQKSKEKQEAARVNGGKKCHPGKHRGRPKGKPRRPR